MKRIKLIICTLLITTAFSSTQAQFTHTKELILALNPSPIGMNFFIGKDAAMFETSGQVFGSGVMDFSAVYPLLPYWLKAPESKFGYAIPLGIRISKYRFANALVFNKNNSAQRIDVTIDNNPEHTFSPSFFSYEGSKLVTGYLHVPFVFQVNITEKFKIFGSAFYDRYIFGYHKLKYTMNGNTQKDIIPNNEFKNYYINKNKYGFSAGIMYSSFGIGATYVPASFFEAGKGPEIQELRVGLIYQK